MQSKIVHRYSRFCAAGVEAFSAQKGWLANVFCWDIVAVKWHH